MANTEKLGTKSESAEPKSANKFINFFKNNQKLLYGILIAILAVIVIAIAVHRFYIIPRNEKASEAILAPIDLYINALSTNDTLSFKKALEGDDEIDGFLTIISDYGRTKTANTAKYYAALCYINIGSKDEALDYLLDYKKNDDNIWYFAQMLIGDLYDDQNDVDNAKKYYQKAIDGETAAVAPTALFKMGMLCERDKNWSEACKMYQQIEDQYYERFTEMGVDKFLER